MITCLGEPLLDVFAAPVGATLEDAETFMPRAGGAPLNVAMVLGRAGVPCRFLGAVGDDALGRRVVRSLERAGVNAGGVVRSARQTGMVLIQVGRDGSREFLGYAGAGAEYDYPVAGYAALTPEPLLGSAWLVVGSGSLTRDPIATALRHVLGRAAALEVPVAVDLNVRAPLWSSREAMVEQVLALAARAEVLRASADDLLALGQAPTLASLRGMNARAVCVLTHGARGAEALLGSTRIEVAAPRTAVVDTTGAGDACTAGLLVHLWRTRMRTTEDPDPAAWREALACACRFGSHACTALGCTEAFAVDPLDCLHAQAGDRR